MRRGHCVDTVESMAMKLAPFFEEEYNDGCRFFNQFRSYPDYRVEMK